MWQFLIPFGKVKMNIFAVCATICVFVVASQAATTTTHRPHRTHEPNEKESYSFYYLPTTHTLIVNTAHNCYVATLTADELGKIHTDAGLRAVELRLVGQMGSATVTTNSSLSAAEVKHCRHAQGYYTIP